MRDTTPISWRGHAAPYTQTERDIIAALPVTEQFVLHALKAFFGGEIQPASASTLHVSPKPEMPKYIAGEENWPEVTVKKSVYIDAEDIPFGAPPVRRPKRSYRLEWTNGSPSLHKTKKVAQRRMRAWVNWKRRNGWNVVTHPTGYFAGRDNIREAVLIREIEKPSQGLPTD